jgi:Transposase DDE domain
MSSTQFSGKAQQLKQFLNTEAEQISREVGVVQRRSKLTGAHLVQMLILGWLANPEASLNGLVQVGRDLGVNISVSALQQRITERTVALLQGLVAVALKRFRQQTRLPEAVLKYFSAVNIVDSSLIHLPDKLQSHFRGSRKRISPAEMKVQLSFDYLSGNLNAIELQSGICPDQRCELPVAWATPGSLTLMDLGYFKKSHLADIDQAGGYFISRLQSQTGLLAQADDDHLIDLPHFLCSLPGSQGEVRVYLKANWTFSVRLIYARLPVEVVAERRRRAKSNAKRRGKSCSQRHLDLLTWALFITNVPSDWLSPQQIMLVYRVRWQVELVFKLWKSQACLDGVGYYGLTRVLCQFYARLLGLILFHWSVAVCRSTSVGEISLPKAFAVFQRYARPFMDVMRLLGRGLAHLLERIDDDFHRFALKTTRRKSPSTFQLLIQFGA